MDAGWGGGYQLTALGSGAVQLRRALERVFHCTPPFHQQHYCLSTASFLLSQTSSSLVVETSSQQVSDRHAPATALCISAPHTPGCSEAGCALSSSAASIALLSLSTLACVGGGRQRCRQRQTLSERAAEHDRARRRDVGRCVDRSRPTSASVSATVYDDASLPLLLPSSESRSGRGSLRTGDDVVHASVWVGSVFCGETLLSTEEEDGLTDLPAEHRRLSWRVGQPLQHLYSAVRCARHRILWPAPTRFQTPRVVVVCGGSERRR